MAKLTTIANLKGDKGDKGDQGLPGPEAVPAATAVAAYISEADPDPDTNPVPAALNAAIEQHFALVSTDGSQGLPAPTGVGFEVLINADGLDDFRLNGVSL
jgi:hypothetical protein